MASSDEQVMKQCEPGEALGYDTFFCAEHHFHGYGVPPIYVAVLAREVMPTVSSRIAVSEGIEENWKKHP